MRRARVSNYLKAAMLRAQCKTVKDASLVHFELKQECEGCFLCQITSGDLRPPGWTEHAFCTSLHFASKGLGLGFDSRADEIAALVQSPSAPGGPRSRKSTQAAFYELWQCFCLSDWDSTLKRKLAFITEPFSSPNSRFVELPLLAYRSRGRVLKASPVRCFLCPWPLRLHKTTGSKAQLECQMVPKVSPQLVQVVVETTALEPKAFQIVRFA